MVRTPGLETSRPESQVAAALYHQLELHVFLAAFSRQVISRTLLAACFLSERKAVKEMILTCSTFDPQSTYPHRSVKSA